MFRAVEFERDGLIDRHSHGFCRGVAVEAGVNRERLSLHASICLCEAHPAFLWVAPVPWLLVNWACGQVCTGLSRTNQRRIGSPTSSNWSAACVDLTSL